MANVTKNLEKWNGIMCRETWKLMRDQYINEKVVPSDTVKRRKQMEVGQMYNLILQMIEAGADTNEIRNVITYFYALVDDANSHEIDLFALRQKLGFNGGRIEELLKKYPRK